MHDLVILAAAIVAAPAGLLWEAWHKRLDATREKRANCSHTWGEIRGYNGFHFKNCTRCNEQMHCNSDGTEYVPPSRRGDG